MSIQISRKNFLHGAALACAALFVSAQPALAQSKAVRGEGSPLKLTPEWDKTFPKSNKVDHQKVTFKNRYGITLAADLYLPKDRGNKRLPALAVGGPFGAVKEQSSGLYAQTLAERGFATLAFDASYTGSPLLSPV